MSVMVAAISGLSWGHPALQTDSIRRRAGLASPRLDLDDGAGLGRRSFGNDEISPFSFYVINK